MNHAHVQYLLVGGGIAASSAAEAIRKHDPVGSVVLVGQEINRPYHRPPLSKQFLRDEVSRESLFTQGVDWFTRHHIELHTGHRVTALDLSRNLAVLDGGQGIGFDHLLISTGSTPTPLEIPGATLQNVMYVRSLADIDRLRTNLDQARRFGRPHDANRGLPRNTTTGRGKIAIIGGGLLGAELAASLAQLGLSVDLIVTAATPWAGIAGEVAGKFIARLLDHHGVAVYANTSATRLEGDGRVQRVVLSGDRTIETDLVIGAVGVTVNRQLLRGTTIRAEKAILVDDHCRTNIANVYAAGDCAAVFDRTIGKHRIGQHWSLAKLTGQIAGENMAGGEMAYDAVANFESQLFDVSIQVFGDARAIDRRIIRGAATVDSSSFMEIGLNADGRVVQIVAIGQHDATELESIVRQRVLINGNEEKFKDPNTRL